jgi:serine/threonine protein phosphatase 1
MKPGFGIEAAEGGRSRTTPSTPDGQRIYAVGDVHGRADLLRDVFAQIDEDCRSYPTRNPLQIYLGDYVDRGPHSREVIDLLIMRQQKHDVVCLKGNHEALALQFLNDPTILSQWKSLGGDATLRSYGISLAGGEDARSQRETAIAFHQALSEKHRAFMEGLPLTHTCGDFFFVHAGVRPRVALDKQSPNDLLWIREEFLLCRENFGKVIVHGHTPVGQPDIQPNRINIDTGAYATGRLTCVVLEGDRLRFL